MRFDGTFLPELVIEYANVKPKLCKDYEHYRDLYTQAKSVANKPVTDKPKVKSV